MGYFVDAESEILIRVYQHSVDSASHHPLQDGHLH